MRGGTFHRRSPPSLLFSTLLKHHASPRGADYYKIIVRERICLLFLTPVLFVSSELLF